MLKRKILAMSLSILLLLSACAVKPTPTDETLPPVTDLGEWDFKVEPTQLDAAGIDVDAGFRLISKNEVTLDFLKSAVKIYPETGFEISQNSSNEFLIQPATPLNENAIYRVDLLDQEGSQLSWAFQTQMSLGITGTIPGQKSQYVPVNSGIEVIFTHKNIENFEEVFSIEPHVNGKFTSNGYAMIFVPDELERGTTYKVTINAGAKVKGSELTMNEPYVFSFTTESSDRDNMVSINNLFNVFTTSQTHFISAFVNDKAINYDYKVDVYAFSSSEGFIKDTQRFDETMSFGTMYDHLETTLPANLTLLNSFSTKPVPVTYGYMDFYAFEMPEQLMPGYYLVRISYEDQTYFAYIQVNDMLVYESQFEDMHFLWLLDSTTNAPVKDARITVDEKFTGQSIFDGTATIAYEGDHADVTYTKIEASGYADFIVRTVPKYIYAYDYGLRDDQMPYVPYNNDYWKYLYTDRGTYLPTDQMNIFAFIKPKSNQSGVYNLSLYSKVNGTHLIESKKVSTTNTGTFSESFEWSDITPGWYSLLVEDGDTPVMMHDFYINEYTKPIYQVDGQLDKEFISAGDSIRFKVNAAFYDGTPVPDMSFNYYMSLDKDWSGNLVTDLSGQAEIVLTPDSSTTNWRPMTSRMNISNTNAENYQVTDFSSFVFLPKDKMLELIYDRESESPMLEILAHELDDSKYSTDYGFMYENLRGLPLDTSVSVKVTESWYEKKEIGQIYDYINKVNVKKYEYIHKSQVVEDKVYDITGGRLVLDMPYVKNSESSFQVEVTLDEGDKGKIVENIHVSDYNRYPTDPLFNFYTLVPEDRKYSYGLNETVRYYLDNNGKVEETSGDKLMVMYLKDGLLRYEIKDNLEGSFAFEKNHIPNIMIQAIYSKDGLLSKTSYAQTISYDYTEREIKIAVTPDHQDYGPGDTAHLEITTTDASGNPYPADVNISIVDEAYFTLFGQQVDFLGTLYASVYGTGILREYLSSELNGGYFDYGNMAEKGGDGSDYYVRSDFKDTATFSTVTTDASGKGDVSFKLPDNLTSWRITYQGINDRLEGANGFININTKLPFHVSTILSKIFITGDNPSVSLRVFGDEAVKGKPVSYAVALEKEGSDAIKEIQKDGVTGEYTNISLGVLGKGIYTITSYANDGTYKDAVEQTFEVVDSTVYFNNKEYFKMSTRTQFDKVYSNAEVTFFNESESNFYNSLLDLRFATGVRIDQLLSAMEARRFIKENFEPDLILWDESIAQYQNYDGGIKLLPYSDSDALLTFRTILLNSEAFNEETVKTYFYDLVRNEASDLHRVVAGLAGLAFYREPVLLDIQDLMMNENLTKMDRIVLANGLEAIGDKTAASSIYKEVLSESVRKGDKLVVTLSDSEGDNHVAAGLLAGLAAKLNDYDNGDLLFDYIYENPSIYEISDIEQLIYLKNRDIMNSEEIKALSGKITLEYGGKETILEIFGFETKTITVTPEELMSLRVKDVVSNVSAYVYALGGVEDLTENKVKDFNLIKEYRLNNQPVNTFKQSDLIKVVITPSVSDKDATYQITDFIPAGFRFMRLEGGDLWYEEQGQKIIFYYSDHLKKQSITYYIQAVMPGTYTADHTVITKLGHTGVNFTDQETLTVQ